MKLAGKRSVWLEYLVNFSGYRTDGNCDQGML